MKLIRNSTYRALKAAEHNLSVKEAENKRLKNELNRIGDELVDARRKLNKYRRQRGAGGKFVKKEK